MELPTHRCSWCEAKFSSSDKSTEETKCRACGMPAYPIREVNVVERESEKVEIRRAIPNGVAV